MLKAHRGEWCPNLPAPLKLATPAEVRSKLSDSMPREEPAVDRQESSTGSSGESAPEWTPREPCSTAASPREPSAAQPTGADFQEAELQPPWVNVGECMPSALADAGWSLRKSPRQSGPCPVPPLGSKFPLRFDMYTPRSPRHLLAQKPGQKECAASSQRREVVQSSAPRTNSDFANVCAEVAEAHTELLARAAELRRRERRLKKLERGATLSRVRRRRAEFDKENISPCSGQATPVSECSSFVGNNRVAARSLSAVNGHARSPRVGRGSHSCRHGFSKHQASHSVDPSPRHARSPRRSLSRRARSRRSVSAGSLSGDDQLDNDRRMKKEIRLERRLRRRAEESAAAVWRNALLVAAAGSLFIVSVTSVFVALAIRS
mmetsp:Transcript_124732/g.216218  ORF Transcript_124732/g.216218 Transcript_124732/m.216218 type:complete len:377 (-) Transcript_124732:89-1219(-)